MDKRITPSMQETDTDSEYSRADIPEILKTIKNLVDSYSISKIVATWAIAISFFVIGGIIALAVGEFWLILIIVALMLLFEYTGTKITTEEQDAVGISNEVFHWIKVIYYINNPPKNISELTGAAMAQPKYKLYDYFKTAYPSMRSFKLWKLSKEPYVKLQ